jgi:hypothetical protein
MDTNPQQHSVHFPGEGVARRPPKVISLTPCNRVGTMMCPTSATDEVDQVREVQFSVLSADQIRKRSACEVVWSTPTSTMCQSLRGLYDPRMGVVDYDLRCSTCHNEPPLPRPLWSHRAQGAHVQRHLVDICVGHAAASA